MSPRLIGPLPVQEKPESGAAALGLENVGGIFLVLVVGLSLSCLVATIEYAWSRRRLTRSNVSTYSTVPQYRTPVQYLSTGHQYSTSVQDTSTVPQWWGSPSPA